MCINVQSVLTDPHTTICPGPTTTCNRVYLYTTLHGRALRCCGAMHVQADVHTSTVTICLVHLPAPQPKHATSRTVQHHATKMLGSSLTVFNATQVQQGCFQCGTYAAQAIHALKSLGCMLHAPPRCARQCCQHRLCIQLRILKHQQPRWPATTVRCLGAIASSTIACLELSIAVGISLAGM
jgi:hypothetical protein